MKSFSLSLRFVVLYLFSIILVVSSLVVARYITADSLVSLVDINCTGILVESSTPGSSFGGVFNETLVADSIKLSGFKLTFVRNGPGTKDSRVSIIGLQGGDPTLIRADQLHIKDLFVQPGTRVVLTDEAGTVGIGFLGDQHCCYGRIGVGSSVKIGQGRLPYSIEALAASDPNIDVSCERTPCSIVVATRSTPINNIIENWQAKNISFERPGTDYATQAHVGESAIISGLVKVTSKDLLGNELALRKIKLAMGDSVGPSSAGDLHLNIDVYNDHFRVNALISGETYFVIKKRSGETLNAIPSILEVILREPWRAQIVTFIASSVPALFGLLINSRRWFRRLAIGKATS